MDIFQKCADYTLADEIKNRAFIPISTPLSPGRTKKS